MDKSSIVDGSKVSIGCTFPSNFDGLQTALPPEKTSVFGHLGHLSTDLVPKLLVSKCKRYNMDENMKSIILGTPHIMADLYPANNQILVA